MVSDRFVRKSSDIIEEIIEEEIVDETDRFESNQTKRRAKRMSTAAVMKGYAQSLFRCSEMLRLTQLSRHHF